MIDRVAVGALPEKPHTVFRAPDGSLVNEEMFTRGGFDGPFSYLYHRLPITAPIAVEALDPSDAFTPAVAIAEGNHPLRRRLYRSHEAKKSGPALHARSSVVVNGDVAMYVATPSEDDARLFANGDGDELWYLFSGALTLESAFGAIEVEPGDYVHVPRSAVHRWKVRSPAHAIVFECRGGCVIPSNFRNPVGQLKMDAPYTHRDFKRPVGPIATFDTNLDAAPKDLVVKKRDRFSLHRLRNTPFDVIGWDGFAYPFAFPIEKYQPKTGLVHLPPTIHTTFVGPGFAICSFVPRVTDTHRDAIPCPYPHSSVDCDEILFYVKGNFTSRRGVGPGCISLHPAGIAHGPHPGAYEASIGSKRTDELAVMIDTFAPLVPTSEAAAMEDRGYHESWAC